MFVFYSLKAYTKLQSFEMYIFKSLAYLNWESRSAECS